MTPDVPQLIETRPSKRIDETDERCELLEDEDYPQSPSSGYEWAEDEVDALRAKKNQLNEQVFIKHGKSPLLTKSRKINSRIWHYEKPGVLELAATMEKQLGGVNQLLLYIYEYLCSEDNGVQVPDLPHKYFHEHPTGEDVQAVANGECWPIDDTVPEEKEERMRNRVSSLRSQFIFDPNLLGEFFSRQITLTFLEKNVFHFRD